MPIYKNIELSQDIKNNPFIQNNNNIIQRLLQKSAALFLLNSPEFLENYNRLAKSNKWKEITSLSFEENEYGLTISNISLKTNNHPTTELLSKRIIEVLNDKNFQAQAHQKIDTLCEKKTKELDKASNQLDTLLLRLLQIRERAPENNKKDNIHQHTQDSQTPSYNPIEYITISTQFTYDISTAHNTLEKVNNLPIVMNGVLASLQEVFQDQSNHFAFLFRRGYNPDELTDQEIGEQVNQQFSALMKTQDSPPHSYLHNANINNAVCFTSNIPYNKLSEIEKKLKRNTHPGNENIIDQYDITYEESENNTITFKCSKHGATSDFQQAFLKKSIQVAVQSTNAETFYNLENLQSSQQR